MNKPVITQAMIDAMTNIRISLGSPPFHGEIDGARGYGCGRRRNRADAGCR